MDKRIVLTGFWLGLLQTGLGYAVLAGAGSSVFLFFAALTAWIGGGAIGAMMDKGNLRALLFFAGLAVLSASALLAAHAFTTGALIAGIAGGMSAGLFAGRFIAVQSAVLQDARRVLFLENNGFTAGLAIGLVLLFVDPALLAGAAGILWAGLLLK